MPVTSLFSSIADKAQSAINASPLAGHIPASLRTGSPDSSRQPTANDAAAQGGTKSHTLENLQYQFRALQQQYSTTTPIQKIITAEKGVALDFDSVSRDSKAQSKELYTWGQSESEDLKDVTDRLAYLNFVEGSLAASLASKLDSARVPFKALRDGEATLLPRRNIRAGIQLQISRLEHEQQKGGDKRIGELRAQLRKAESDDQPLEHEVEILKRKAVRESEQAKWDAFREYGEKLVLLSQAASPIIAVLPSIPPTHGSPYAGAQTTGAVRASLQRALDNYKTGHINLPPQVVASELSRSDTRSFGESHASELSSISSDISAYQTTPQSSTQPLPSHDSSPPPSVINPQNLNQSPVPIPLLTPTPSTTIADPVQHLASIPLITPTIADTGLPISSGPDGPGPSSGSLLDLKASAVPSKLEFANEEKKLLASSYTVQSSSTSVPVQPTPSPISRPVHESAEEEKKRLEREERERVLHENANQSNQSNQSNAPPDDELPPYQEPGFQ